MRIGIDGGCWSNRRGYGRFLRELLGALAAKDKINEYSIFLDADAHRSFHLGARFRPILVPTAQSVGSAATSDGRRPITDMLRMSYTVARTPVDVFLFPSVFSYFPLIRPVPTIVGIHDTIADQNPQFSFASRKQHFFWRAKVKCALAQAEMILTVSEYSKRSIERVLGVPPTRIRVLYEGASPIFRRISVEPPAERFLLYVGGISPNKNLATLIQAFHNLKDRRNLALVLVGDYRSDGFKSCYAELQELVCGLGLQQEVRFAGYVPDDDLVALYNSTTAFVMPSLDEGFGLPALEAMACGAPVIVSCGNSLSEIVGTAAVVVDPHDPAALTAAMERVVGNPAFAAELSRQSLTRATEFSWAKAAEQLMEFLEEAKTFKIPERGSRVPAKQGTTVL